MAARSAIIPGSVSDPTTLSGLEKKAMREFNRRMRRILKAYKDLVNDLPVEPAVNRRYEYRVVPDVLIAMLDRVGQIVDDTIMGTRTNGDYEWFFEEYVAVAAARGLAQQHANLSAQSPAYKAIKPTVMGALTSDPFLRRMALVRAREFEEMRNLSADVKANMTRVLTDGIGRGLNPRVVARQLTEQAGIEARRAHRIARTEIPTALRRARWDEVEDAREELNFQSKELHLSALSPTTRATHAARHGKLYTIDEVRDWWSQGANSINCLCSTTTVLTGDDGKPLSPEVLERARKVKARMARRGYPWSDT